MKTLIDIAHQRQHSSTFFLRPSLHWIYFLLLSAIFFYSIQARAEVYQCRNAQGSISFQERPCNGLAPDEAPKTKTLPPPKAEPAQLPDQENVVPSKQNNFQIPAIPESWVAKAPGTQSVQDSTSNPSSSGPHAAQVTTSTNSSPTLNGALQTSGESNHEVSQTRMTPSTHSLFSRLGDFLPVPFAILAALGWAVPWMRMMARSALDGRQRTPMVGTLYRGYWWRGACAGAAFALAVVSRTDGILWALALLALIPIGWSIKLGSKVDFILFGEFDFYERQDFPDLYDESTGNEYEIQDGAVGRVIPRLLGAAGVTAFFYWGISGFHSNSLFASIATWLSALFAIIGAVMTLGYLALLAFLMFRSKETFH